ncbi:MAG: TonB-dependent receptor [Gammaproteobacteria bacterium]|nr:MAG: TonB-dependent receptor [Gammaproteobacteria bacterium]
MKTIFPAALAAILLPSVTQAETSGGQFIEEITIVGDRGQVGQITGSAEFIGPEDLEKFEYTDVQRILRQAPGVSLQVEDGYGLRPNISIRGVPTERSGRITLLEDNVLIAPAPYSAPSAYYFPTTGRMQAMEVLKGPAAITQGPYTIGGALNMISTAVPEQSRGGLFAEAGEDETYRLHAHWGTTTDSGFGFMGETHQWRSNGFQSVDRSDTDTGLDIEDYTLKLSYAPIDSRHALELKLQYADQTSNQSYLGLTDQDFAGDAWRRYGLSELDQIDTEHQQQVLRYQFDVSDTFTFTATAYNNEHERDWFKTEGIDFDGSDNAEEFSRTSWSSVIQAVNRGEDAGGATATELNAILQGADTAAGAIQIRSNAREYYSRGIQLRGNWLATIGNTRHDLEIGVRYHEDEEDRLQRNSTYTQVDGALVLDDLGLLGNAGNRIQNADAWALHIYDRIEFGRWVVAPGLRYEDIDQSRIRYEIRPDRSDDPASRASDNARDSRENSTQVWLPGIGVLYQVNDSLGLLGGIHKGFSAPPNAPGIKEEESINYEIGLRYNTERWHAEAVAFLTDFKNLLGVCTASSGSDCEVGDAFNGDAATIRGLEFRTGVDLAGDRGFQVPFDFTWTWTDSEFDTDIADTEYWGDVSKGDPVPYIPEHQFLLRLGFLISSFSADLSANYIDAVCTRPACGDFEKTDDSLTLDLGAAWAFTDGFDVFARVENLTNEKDIMGRQPYGARPNKARTAAIGVRLAF